MKTFPLLVFIFMFFWFGGQAQINLVGVYVNSNNASIDVVKWQVLDSTTLTTYPTVLQSWVRNSALFDAHNGKYYLSAITPGFNGLLTFNTVTNETSLSPYNAFSSATEIDMSTGKIYSLTSDSLGKILIIEYDINTGKDSLRV